MCQSIRCTRRVFSLFVLISLLLLSCETEKYPYYLSADHGVLWIANSADNTATCINRIRNETIGTYPVGPNPSRTAVDLFGNCWVGSRNDDTVWFVTQSGETEVYHGFNNARGVALDREGNVWIANSGNSTIQKIDTSTGSVSGQVTIPGATYLYGAVIDGNNTLWLSDSSSDIVFRYDTAQFPSIDTLDSVSVDVYGITVDFDGYVWAAGPGSGVISRIDPDTMEVMAITTTSVMLSGVTPDIHNRIWFCDDYANALIRYDPQTEEFDSFPVNGTRPHGVAADDNGFVYSVNMDSDTVSKLDVETGEIIHIFEVGSVPYTYSDLTGFIYRRITLGGNDS